MANTTNTTNITNDTLATNMPNLKAINDFTVIFNNILESEKSINRNIQETLNKSIVYLENKQKIADIDTEIYKIQNAIK